MAMFASGPKTMDRLVATLKSAEASKKGDLKCPNQPDFWGVLTYVGLGLTR
jgi:hypothetical protein